jgi:predicted AlkP superfamily phosphohydrolase/phosphomutase
LKITVFGIDGLELNIINKYIDNLPGFKFIKENGCLGRVQSVFPADSVPAWTTIFTGLNPSAHGIIRGKDYVESVEDFEKLHHFKLQGNTFWDKLSEKGKKCLIINPFLAYPAWPINGTMVSGPAFVEGDISKYPDTTKIIHPETFGGYQAISSLDAIKKDLISAHNHTRLLWEEYIELIKNDYYDLSFITFTTLDRIQHYSWRYFDKDDPLYAEDKELSNIIFNTLKLFDSYIDSVIKKMSNDDCIYIVSDHGFARRPYNLINLNELLRKQGFLKLNSHYTNSKITILKQKFKNHIVKILSDLKLLDKVVSKLKKNKKINQLKKSDFLIDVKNSVCFADSLFNGKKPYCGICFGELIKLLPDVEYKKYEDQIILFIKEQLPVKPLWVKTNAELFSGKFSNLYPDICFELPCDFGIEFNFFTDIVTKSVTHYRISGGHLGDGTFAGYSPNGKFNIIETIEQFSDAIISSFK